MRYFKGDVVEQWEQCPQPAALIHQVNCQMVMNSGVAKQIRDKYPEHYEDYKWPFKIGYKPLDLLGDYVVSHTENDNKLIIGLFSQYNYGYNGHRYTNYVALIEALGKTVNLLKGKQIFIPYRLGCDRGGGDWSVVSLLLEDFEKLNNVEFTIVELKK